MIIVIHQNVFKVPPNYWSGSLWNGTFGGHLSEKNYWIFGDGISNTQDACNFRQSILKAPQIGRAQNPSNTFTFWFGSNPRNILQCKIVTCLATHVTGAHMWQKWCHRWHLFGHLCTSSVTCDVSHWTCDDFILWYFGGGVIVNIVITK